MKRPQLSHAVRSMVRDGVTRVQARTSGAHTQPRRRRSDRQRSREVPAETGQSPAATQSPETHGEATGISVSLPVTLAAEQGRGEVLVGWVQMGLIGTLAMLYALAPKAFPPSVPFAPVPIFLAAYFAFTALRLQRAYAGRLGDRFIALSVVIDVSLLFGLIWSFHLQYQQPASFYLKSPTFLYVFVFIALRALRFDARWVVLTGLLAIVGWLVLIAYALVDGAVITRSYVRYMTSNDILVGAEVDKMLIVALTTGIVGFVVHRARTLLARQIDARREIATLNRRLRSSIEGLRSEIDRRRRSERQMQWAAYHDRLTGANNRSGLIRTLEQLMEADGSWCGAVIALDIDRFRLINSAAGHTVGDEVLRSVAERLQSRVRSDDVVARAGNDEFALVVVLDRADTASLRRRRVLAIVERVREALSAPVLAFGGAGGLTACYGVAVTEPDSRSAEELLRDAELALERARSRGPDTALFFEPSWREVTRERHRIELDLARGLREREFSLVYQPIVDLRTGKTCCFEALMRWRHPERGSVPPAEFIPVAEATGMIHALGARALHEAIAQLERWQRELAGDIHDLGVSVNLSNRQFDRPDELLATIRAALAEDRVAPDRLHLEITESVLMADPEGVNEVLEAISRLGPRIMLDDFGTGYSSFGMLARLRVDGLKIDRTFVPAVTAPGRGRELVKSMLSMAHALNLGVVVEGVETRAQLESLRALGCPHAQGYFLGRPCGAGEARSRLAGGAAARCAI